MINSDIVRNGLFMIDLNTRRHMRYGTDGCPKELILKKMITNN